MAIKPNLIKRIEAAEKKIVQETTPDLIMISYNWEREKFEVAEQFLLKSGNGSKSKIHYCEHYKEYVIPADFEGTVLLNLLDCPEEFQKDLFAVPAGELKKELNATGCGISLEYAAELQNKQESKFNITIIKYAE